MSKWTDKLPEAAREYIGNRRVDEVECIIGDIAGVARGKAMPASKFAKQKTSSCRIRSFCRRSPANGPTTRLAPLPNPT
jgi:glutamine synthetase